MPSSTPPASDVTTPSGRRLQVFSIRATDSGSVWVRAGSAWTNRDGSVNVYLDVLPLDGKLHIREALEAGAKE